MKKKITQHDQMIMENMEMDERSYNVYRLTQLTLPKEYIKLTKGKCKLSDEQYTEFKLKLKDAVEKDHLRVMELSLGLDDNYDYYPKFYEEIQAIMQAEGYEKICEHSNNIDTIRKVLKEAERMVIFSRALRKFPYPWSIYDEQVKSLKENLAEVTEMIKKLKIQREKLVRELKRVNSPNLLTHELQPLDVKEIREKSAHNKRSVDVKELNFSKPVVLALEHEGVRNLQELENLGIKKICAFRNFKDEYCEEIVERLEQIGVLI